MSSAAQETSRLAAWLADEAADAAGRLAETGTLHEGMDAVRAGEMSASLASVAGEKEQNEDAVVLWTPPGASSVRWAAAVADGVSACFYPGLASRLACLAGLAHMRAREHEPATPATDLSPVGAAQSVFDRLTALVQSDPDGVRPEGTTSSTWKRVVRDGAYAQTTLVALWQDDEALHVEGVGDGGLLVEIEGEFFEYLPRANRSVRCLGPGRAGLKVNYRLTFPSWSCVAAFSDGMTPWARENASALLPQHAECKSMPTAAGLVSLALQETNVRDNVSLLLVGRGAG